MPTQIFKRKLIFLLLGLFSIVEAQDIKHISELYAKGEFKRVDNLCLKYLKEQPTNTELLLTYGRSLADQGKFSEAIPYLLEVVRLDKTKTWPSGWAYGYLGTCYYFETRLNLSKAYLDSCASLNATKNSTQYAKKRLILFGLNNDFNKWDTIETEKIRFHFQDSTINQQDFIKARLAAYKKITMLLPCTLPKKIDYFVWSDRQAAQKILLRPLGFSLTDECVIHSYFNQTDGHELTHVIIKHSIKPIKQTRLINEGIAVALDQTDGDRLKKAQLAMIDLQLKSVSVVDLWKSGKGDDALFYPVAGAWCDFLMRELRPELLKTLLFDQSYEEAKKILGKDLKKLVKKFEEQLFSKG